MGSHPHDGVEGGLLVAVDRLVPGEEVRVLEQLTPVPTQALDVLQHGDSEDGDYNDIDSDDNDAPEVQKIQHISEEVATGSNVIKAPQQCKKNNETQSTKQKEKSYSEILKRPRRPTTLLETLLDSEIKQERYDLLQCIHYVVSNNFFGIGANKK